MRTTTIAVMAAIALSSSAAAAEITIDNLLASMNEVTSASAQQCEGEIDRAEDVNSVQLFYGSQICYRAKRPGDGAFLMTAAQMRAMADLGAFKPPQNDKPNYDRATKLYGIVFYRLGGIGPDSLLRNRQESENLINRLEAWKPNLSDDYNPGWDYKQSVDMAAYSKELTPAKNRRLAQLRELAVLFRDEGYFALHKEQREILDRNKGSIKQGSVDDKRMAELSKQMRQIHDKLLPTKNKNS
jgi:hypothetical protein